MRYITADTQPFLEVDYLTMSAFVLFDPFIISYLPPTEFIENRINIYRLYN